MVLINLGNQSQFLRKKLIGLLPWWPKPTCFRCWKSIVIKIIRFKKLQFKIRNSCAQKYWTGKFQNRNSKQHFFKTNCWFATIDILLDYCHLLGGFSKDKLLLMALSNGNHFERIREKCADAGSTLMIKLSFHDIPAKNFLSNPQSTVYNL